MAVPGKDRSPRDRLIHDKAKIRRRRHKPVDRPRDPLLTEDFTPREAKGCSSCCLALSLFWDAACNMPLMGKVWMLLKVISSVTQVEVLIWGMGITPQLASLFVPQGEGGFKETEGQRTAEYHKLLGLFTLCGFFYMLGRSFMVYTIQGVRLHFRTYLTKKLMARYFSINNYYHLASQPEIDNPGQRIVDDVDLYTHTMTYLLDEQLARFYMITRLAIAMLVKDSRMMLLFPYWFGAMIVILLVTPMFIRALKRTIASNAIFREGMTQVQEYGENIAFCDAQKHEDHWARARLHKAVSDLWSFAHREAVLDTIMETCKYFGDIIPYAILARSYVVSYEEYKKMEATGIKPAELLDWTKSANGMLFDATFTFFKEGNLQKMGNLFAPVRRIQELIDFFDHHEKVIRHQRNAVTYGAKSLALQNVSVKAPGGKKLAQHLDFQVAPGDSVLISGPSGVGKSSLMRVLCGLWAPESGSIYLPDKDKMMFLPQQVYVPAMPRKDNSLRNQVLFPHTLAAVEDKVIEQALLQVNLGHLLGRKGIHTIADWRKRLSGGERQRLAMARILVAKPRMAFLDEATSALDPSNERRLYEALQTSGATYVSVTHKSELRKYHSHVLELTPDGGYYFYRCSEFAGQLRGNFPAGGRKSSRSPSSGRSRSRSRGRKPS